LAMLVIQREGFSQVQQGLPTFPTSQFPQSG
jgi:hypothetical protein